MRCPRWVCPHVYAAIRGRGVRRGGGGSLSKRSMTIGECGWVVTLEASHGERWDYYVLLLDWIAVTCSGASLSPSLDRRGLRQLSPNSPSTSDWASTARCCWPSLGQRNSSPDFLADGIRAFFRRFWYACY